MKKLIEVRQHETLKQAVSARDLYLGLGLEKAHWKRWAVANIENNDFFKENIDWQGFTIKANGNETKDFAISIDFAKHIAMSAKTKNSHDYRNYLIACENKVNTHLPALPKTFSEALRMLADETEAKEALQIKVDEQKQTISSYRLLHPP